MRSRQDSYNETVHFLYDLRKHGIKLGLENPAKLLAVLGEPHNSFRSIHIAGTNGKGSTAAIIASILRKNNISVGLFTSPHLASFTERIKINNIPISENEVISLTTHIRDTINNSGIQPTFFEFVTALAFFYFAQKKVDWCVIEVGMGGRFDATNILLPEISVITNVGIDHSEFLGKGIPDIAYEKAGIIKQKTPVVTGVKHPEAFEVLRKVSEQCSSELHVYGRDFKSDLISMDDKYIVFDYSSMHTSIHQNSSFRDYKNLSLPLSGIHQMDNASLAIRTSEIIRQKGFPVSDEAIRNGISGLSLEGRFEQVSQSPHIIIDSAHNPEAALALARTVKENIPAHKEIIFITGIMSDKDIKGIMKPLLPLSKTFILTRPKGERAATPEQLKDCLIQLLNEENKDPGLFSILTSGTVEEALQLAKSILGKDHIIIVTGSFYITGEVKELLEKPGVLSHLRER
jgi:dihydrofolate synthase/folylpolyglutamate synthase